MRALVVITFLIVAAALAFSLMAIGRVDTTLKVANEASDKVSELSTKQAETPKLIQAELGATRAGLETRISGLDTQLRKVVESAPNEAVIKAQVGEAMGKVGKQYMELAATVADLQAKLREKDTKIAQLETKVNEVSAENAELKSAVIELSRLVRGFLAIIAPAETVPPPEAPKPTEEPPAQ